MDQGTTIQELAAAGKKYRIAVRQAVEKAMAEFHEETGCHVCSTDVRIVARGFVGKPVNDYTVVNVAARADYSGALHLSYAVTTKEIEL